MSARTSWPLLQQLVRTCPLPSISFRLTPLPSPLFVAAALVTGEGVLCCPSRSISSLPSCAHPVIEEGAAGAAPPLWDGRRTGGLPSERHAMTGRVRCADSGGRCVGREGRIG